MLRRQFISGLEDFSHRREVPVEEISPYLIGIALESMAIYKQCYQPYIFESISNSFLRGLITISQSDPSLAEGTNYMIQNVSKLIQGQDIRTLDMMIQDPFFINYLRLLCNILLKEDNNLMRVLRKICQVFKINLTYQRSSSITKFKSKNSLNCYVLTDYQSAYFYYYKISSYRIDKEIQVEQQNTIEYYACGHIRNGMMKCNCKHYSIENTHFFCTLCNIKPSVLNLKEVWLCISCCIHAVFIRDIQNQLNLRLSAREKLGVLQKFTEKKIDIGRQGFCVVCSAGELNICKCMCARCYLEYGKDLKNCCYCRSLVDDSYLKQCSECRKKGLESDFFLFNKKYLCKDHLIRKIKYLKYFYKIDKNALYWLVNQGIQLNDILMCFGCMKKTIMACLCCCIQCASFEQQQCSRCNFTYPSPILEMLYNHFCSLCLKKDCKELNEFQLCDHCSMEIIMNKTRSYFGVFLQEISGADSDRNLVLVNEERNTDLRALFTWLYQSGQITMFYCLNCFKKKEDGCDCLCFDCASSFHFEICEYCQKPVKCLKIAIMYPPLNCFNLCEENSSQKETIEINDIPFCSVCLYILLDNSTDPVSYARYRTAEPLSTSSRGLMINLMRQKLPDMNEFRCAECLEQRRISCCVLCIYCRKNYDSCPYCNSQLCRICHKYGELMCECTCRSCYMNLNLNSCMFCFSVLNKSDRSPEKLTINQMDKNKAYSLLIDYSTTSKIMNESTPDINKILSVNKWFKESNYSDEHLLCTGCNQFKILQCYCTCKECALGNEKCLNCYNYCKTCGELVDESLCRYSCECYSCVSRAFCENEINCSCKHCRSPYKISSIENSSYFMRKCECCRKIIVANGLLLVFSCDGRSRYVCLDCARDERNIKNTYKISHVLLDEKTTFIDCCQKTIEGIRLCNCPEKHLYHSICIPPCARA